MKSTSPDSARAASPRGQRSVGSYILPVMAIPSVLLTPIALRPVTPMFQYTVRSYGDAVSDLGASLDHSIAENTAVVASASPLEAEYMASPTFPRHRRNVQRLTGRVHQRAHEPQFVESPEELAVYLDAPSV